MDSAALARVNHLNSALMLVAAALAWVLPVETFITAYVVLGPLHYLNWFSKTQLLRWHAVSRPRLAAIAALWVACLALYAADYEGLGFLIVGFVGMLHVFFELPLDVRTFAQLPGLLVRAVAGGRRGGEGPAPGEPTPGPDSLRA